MYQRLCNGIPAETLLIRDTIDEECDKTHFIESTLPRDRTVVINLPTTHYLIYHYRIANTPLRPRQLLAETSSSSSLISKYGRLVGRNLRRDVEDKVFRGRQKTFRALINMSCSCSLHSLRASNRQITSPANGSVAASMEIDQSFRNVVERAVPISQ